MTVNCGREQIENVSKQMRSSLEVKRRNLNDKLTFEQIITTHRFQLFTILSNVNVGSINFLFNKNYL